VDLQCLGVRSNAGEGTFASVAGFRTRAGSPHVDPQGPVVQHLLRGPAVSVGPGRACTCDLVGKFAREVARFADGSGQSCTAACV
jgi:hypothetical protein